MKDNIPYIVVAQTHEDSLKRIKQEVNRKTKNQPIKNRVIYTSNPGDVLIEVTRKPIDVVITGDRFYRTNLKSEKDLAMALRANRNLGPYVLHGIQQQHFHAPLSGPDSGCELSEEIYKLNPEILVFRYSFTPHERGKIVGDIEKFALGSESYLARFITSRSLPRILKDKDFETLEKKFSSIRFYKGWQEEHKF